MIECWKQEYFASRNLCASTANDCKNDKLMAQKLKQIKIGTYMLYNIGKYSKHKGLREIKLYQEQSKIVLEFIRFSF